MGRTSHVVLVTRLDVSPNCEGYAEGEWECISLCICHGGGILAAERSTSQTPAEHVSEPDIVRHNDLMFVVMSTPFKGRLTSLLNNLPLEGEATQFVSFEHLSTTLHRLCFLENPGNLGDLFKTDAPIKSEHYCYETLKLDLHRPRSIKISADGTDTFFTYNSRTGPSEALRRELLGRGYVVTEGTVLSYPIGQEMRASPVYRQDFGATLSRAIETGLYEKDAALAEYKSRYCHESTG